MPGSKRKGMLPNALIAQQSCAGIKSDTKQGSHYIVTPSDVSPKIPKPVSTANKLIE